MRANPSDSNPWSRSHAPALAALVALCVLGCGPGDEALFTRIDGIVRGTVLNGLDPTEPVGQARISLLGNRSSSTFTRPDGTYELRSVRPGLYDLVADRDVDGANRRVRFRFVEVVPGQVINLPDLDLEVPGSLSGTAFLEGAGPGNTVAPDHSGIQVELVGTTLNALTGADGSYSIPVVEQGDYAARFTRDQFESETQIGISVASGAATVVTSVTLARLAPPTTGILRGRVVLEAKPGADFSGITVNVDGTTRSLVTTTGGYWAFTDLPVGTYDVAFCHPDYYCLRLEDQQVLSGYPINETATTTLSNHQVLNASVTASGLSVAPSGNQIAYLTDAGNNSQVGLLSPEGVTFNQVITTNARAAGGRGIEWLPDESRIVFTQFQGGGAGAFAPALVNDTGSEIRTLLATGTDYFMGTFSPDGSELTYYLTQNLLAVDMGRDSFQRTIAVTSTIRTVATGLGVVTELNGIEWSNTGRIAYDIEAGTGTPDDIFTVLGQGGFAPQRLGPRRRDPPNDTGAALQGRMQSPTFSPDYSRIVFTIEPGSTDPQGIWVCDVDGENAMQISSSPGQYLDWIPDGSRIYYVDLTTRRPEVLKVPSFAR